MRRARRSFIGGIGIIGITVLTSGKAAAFDISAGINGGLAIAFMTGKDAEEGWKRIPRGVLNGGALVKVNFVSWFGVEVDCIYSMRDMKVARDSAGSVREVVRRSYTYLDMPVLLKLTATSDETAPVRQTYFAGPFFGKLLSAEKTTSGTGDSTDGTVDVQDDVEPWDIGFVVGAGVEIDAGPGKVFIDFRYTQGLFTVEKPGKKETKCGETVTTTEDTKTSLLGITVGYVFTF